jgi:hypothetical protein
VTSPEVGTILARLGRRRAHQLAHTFADDVVLLDDAFVCFNPLAVLERSAEDRRGAAIYGRTEDDVVTNSKGPGVCVGAAALGAQQLRDVAGAVGGVPWEAHVDCRASDQVTRL